MEGGVHDWQKKELDLILKLAIKMKVKVEV